MTNFIVNIPDNERVYDNTISKYRKEKHYSYSLILLAVNKHSHIQNIADVRLYHTPSRSYCFLWVFLPDFNLRGGAFAGGYGYHHDSAALEYALINAGIGVKNLEGRGSGAMERALIELGNKINDKYDLGLSNFTVIKAHG